MIDLIGRSDEAAAIDRFMDRVPRGPAGLLVIGEPGIGKTTVLSEAVRRAHGRRYRVLPRHPEVTPW